MSDLSANFLSRTWTKAPVSLSPFLKTTVSARAGEPNAKTQSRIPKIDFMQFSEMEYRPTPASSGCRPSRIAKIRSEQILYARPFGCHWSRSDEGYTKLHLSQYVYEGGATNTSASAGTSRAADLPALPPRGCNW